MEFFALSLIVFTALSFACASQKVLPVGTHYATIDIQRFKPKVEHVFIASTCGNFGDFDVTVGIELFHNPEWCVCQGVVRFYVTDVKPEAGMAQPPYSVLCHNEPTPGSPEPNCTVTGWNGTKTELYVVTTNGNVGGIDFSVLLEFSKPAKNVRGPIRGKGFIPSFVSKPITTTSSPTYLTQTIKMDTTLSLPYLENVVIALAFCSNEATTEKYEIVSTIFGIGSQSAFNQYVCNELPCTPDSPHVLNSNPYEEAVNVAMVNTIHGDISKLFVSIYCWGGEYDLDAEEYRGHFQYGAELYPMH